jgi:hypothetical protein
MYVDVIQGIRVLIEEFLITTQLASFIGLPNRIVELRALRYMNCSGSGCLAFKGYKDVYISPSR